jgi:hypothetical protein
MDSNLKALQRARILRRYFLELEQIGVGPGDAGYIEYEKFKLYIEKSPGTFISIKFADPFLMNPFLDRYAILKTREFRRNVSTFLTIMEHTYVNGDIDIQNYIDNLCNSLQ